MVGRLNEGNQLDEEYLKGVLDFLLLKRARFNYGGR